MCLACVDVGKWRVCGHSTLYVRLIKRVECFVFGNACVDEGKWRVNERGREGALHMEHIYP